jgi:hypothetical protein
MVWVPRPVIAGPNTGEEILTQALWRASVMRSIGTAAYAPRCALDSGAAR